MILEVKEISLAFENELLKNISFSLSGGEIIGIVGKSGVGKSSLLKMIAGTLNSSSGKIIFYGQEMPLPALRHIPGNPGIEMVNQDFKLDLYHTCEENIREAILHLPTDQRERRVTSMLQLFDLKKVKELKANVLSGGEQQRLALARTISRKPKLLLLDEPFSHLDARLRVKLSKYIRAIRNKEKITIILVSHDGQDVLGLCDKVGILSNGKLSVFRNPIDHFFKITSKSIGELFGPVNQIILENKKVLFRPMEYLVSDTGIPVRWEDGYFNGMIFVNFLKTDRNEDITLYSMKSLKLISHICLNFQNDTK